VLEISPWALARSLSGVIQASVGMLACVFFARLLLVGELGDAWLLVVLTALGAATFAALCWWRAPDVVGELRGLRRRSQPAPAAA
jgi:hypothetical protein